MAIFLTVVAFLVMFAGVPVFVALGIGAELLIAIELKMSQALLIAKGVGYLQTLIWLAIPLFIFAGNLANETGAAKQVVNLLITLIGKVRGSLALVMVLSVGVFGAISGSILASIVAIGSVMMPIMEKEGYSRKFSAALMAIAGVIDMLIPPSNVFVVYCGLTETAVGPMLLAGVLPGILLIVLLVITIKLLPEGKIRSPVNYTWKDRAKAFRLALPVLLMPVIILGGLFSGIFDPVEAGAIACWLIALVGIWPYRTLTAAALMRAVKDTVTTSAMIFVLCFSAVGFTTVFSFLGVPQFTAGLALSLSVLAFMMVMFGGMFFLGIFLEAVVVLFVVVPILWPAVIHLNINSIYFGVATCIAAAIGQSTPPLCIALYTSAAVAKVDPMEVIPKMLPFLLAEIVCCIICILVPQIVMILPQLLYGPQVGVIIK